MNFSLPHPGVQAALAALLLCAAAYDIRYRRIPNWLTAGGVVVGLVMNAFSPPFGGIMFALKGLGLGFGLYFALYAIRAMGAGDVKLMAAVGAMVGWQNWFGIFLITAILGGIAAVLLMVARKRVGTTLWNLGFIFGEMTRGRPAYLKKEELDVRSPKSVGLPHGAVIAAGSFVFLAFAYLGV